MRIEAEGSASFPQRSTDRSEFLRESLESSWLAQPDPSQDTSIFPARPSAAEHEAPIPKSQEVVESSWYSKTLSVSGTDASASQPQTTALSSHHAAACG